MKVGDPISKSELTKQLEKEIFRATQKQGTFGCLEVTIGWFGKERVDYLTYNTNGDFKCYEIKISKQDFYSKNHNTFCGDLNYYVMPYELYQQVKQDIPKHIGVVCGGNSVKKAVRQKCGVDRTVLYESMIRSLSRDLQKQYMSEDDWVIDILKREKNQYKRKAQETERENWKLWQLIGEKWTGGVRGFKKEVDW